jgi:hypothetical protein
VQQPAPSLGSRDVPANIIKIGVKLPFVVGGESSGQDKVGRRRKSKPPAAGPRSFYKRSADDVFAIYIAVVHAWSFSSG